MFNWNKIPRPQLIHYWDLRFDEINSNIIELEEYNKIMEEYLDNKESQTNTEIENSFGNIFRSSFLIQILALLEHELREICLLIESYNYQKFTINDLKGQSDIEKAKLYLTKTIELDFNTLNPEWGFIKNCYGLRNSFIHAQGNLEESSSLLEFVKKNESLIFNGGTAIMRPKRKMIYSFVIKDAGLNTKLINDTKILFKKIKDYIHKINTFDN